MSFVNWKYLIMYYTVIWYLHVLRRLRIPGILILVLNLINSVQDMITKSRQAQTKGCHSVNQKESWRECSLPLTSFHDRMTGDCQYVS